MKMSNDTYDTLKWISQILLPALAVFLATVFELFNLPYGVQVVGVVSAIDAFIGALLKKSSDEYAGDGVLVVDTTDPFKDVYSIAIEDYPEKLAEKKQVLLKVERPAHMKE